jgi:16S rRNA (guanine966-N2)-methyltransferase
MVEREPKVLAALSENAKMLENPPGMEIIRGDALQYLASTKSKFDLIFLDPPFNKGWIPRIEPLLAGVANGDAAVYIEAEHEVAALGDWRAVRHGKAGEVHFQLMRRESG